MEQSLLMANSNSNTLFCKKKKIWVWEHMSVPLSQND